MSEIHILDQNTINQIAAGEVVERPASIVKELVENAVDARSTAVTIEIKGGGIDFIRITDNGFGIEKDQVKKAFLQHATSKIESAEDLLTVQSLGFRGEALSSICAVSKVELITKTDEGISGVRYIIEGGEEISFEEIGCPEGTTFVVRNLFYNTPARKKFLKSAMTEAGYVEAFVQRLALSHPDISFKFICDNKNRIATSGNGNLKDVIYHIFGRDIAMNLLEVNHQEAGIHVRGFAGKPVISRGNRNYENYFVNGRYLKNNIIARSIEDGYKGHTMVHKFPFTALMIEMDSRLFDVNVHPAKMEMRFKNAEELYSVMVAAVRGCFVKKDLISEITLGREKQKVEKRRISAPEPFEKKRKEIEAHFSGLSQKKLKEIERLKKETSKGGDAGGTDAQSLAASLIQKKIEGLKLSELHPKIREEFNETFPEERQKQHGSDILPVNQPQRYKGRKEEATIPAWESFKASEASGEGNSNPPEGTQMSFSDIPFLAKEAKPGHRIIGQVFRTYWLVEYEDKLFFVDQHAAHEKVMYEKLKNALDEKKIHQQMVAPPIILSFNMKEKNKYLLCREAFAALGYQIEEFGEDSYCIRAVPANLYGLDQQELFVELLDQIDEGSTKLDLTMITDRLAAMACKAAVKGNQTLSFQEMDSLMEQLMELDNPYQCPHGRPTIISMTKYELEKRFKRIQ